MHLGWLCWEGGKAGTIAGSDIEVSGRIVIAARNDAQEVGSRPPPAVVASAPRWWRRPRVAVGVALVGTSAVLGSWALDQATSAELVWAATRDLAPGTALEPGDLREVGVAWNDAEDLYLAGEVPTI